MCASISLAQNDILVNRGLRLVTDGAQSGSVSLPYRGPSPPSLGSCLVEQCVVLKSRSQVPPVADSGVVESLQVTGPGGGPGVDCRPRARFVPFRFSSQAVRPHCASLQSHPTRRLFRS